MAVGKFYGPIGYGSSKETEPGVYEDVIVEHNYYGDVTRDSRQLQGGDKVNNDLSVGNSIEILADPYAREHFHAMRYVKWSGARWIISDVEVRSPRLLLRLGGVYNGPTPSVSGTP